MSLENDGIRNRQDLANFIDQRLAQRGIPQGMQTILAQTVVAEEPLRTIRGNVDTTGAAADGAGYTAARNGAGDYTVSFDTAFADRVTPVVTPSAAGAARQWSFSSLLSTGFRVVIRDGAGTATDTQFLFVAEGPR